MNKDKNYTKKSLLLKLDTQTKKVSQKIEKVPQVLEEIFEKLADKHSSCTFFVDTLICVSTFLTIFFYCASFYGFGPPEDKQNKAQKDLVLPKMIIALPLICSFACLVSAPKKCEYRAHFSDLGGPGLVSVLVYIIASVIYILISTSSGLMTYDPFAMIGLFVTLVLCLFSACIKAQKCTKLRFTPDKDNHKYTLINAVSKDKGSVCIIESNAFKIRLMNVGIQNWESSHFSIHRHTGTGKRGKCVKFNLPYFLLEPEQQIDLVPETLEFEGDCIRIPKLHCFGTIDRCTEVKTFVVDNERTDDLKEEDGITSCTRFVKKVAEYIATYNDNEWPNIYVY